MAVDTDTKKYLEEVKKGKPRRFVMICKGVKILSLIIYKKGTVEKYKKQAKEEGKGQFFYGVVSGKGVDITFSLLRSDGFEKPPGKEITLKEFLKTEADMKFKPTYAIVDELPGVDESDDEPSGETSSGGTTAPDHAAESFKSRLAVLIPQIKQAAGTPAGDQAKLKASEAGLLARKNEYSRAHALLDEVEKLLSQAGGTAPETTDSGMTRSADQFKQRLAALVPRIKPLIGTPAGAQAKLKAGEAAGLASNRDFVAADALLDEIERLLQQRPESPEPSDQTSEKQPSLDWEAAKASWRLASDTIDGQITQLQTALKKSGDGELVEIAEFGLNALTGNYKVPLMAAIRDIDGTSQDRRAKPARKALGVISAFRQHIDSSMEVDAVDNNPFGVKLSIRGSLSKAFTDMEHALQTMIAE